jgi:hypothetical protein
MEKINKRLENAASQRGSVAHYSLDFEYDIKTPGPSPDIVIGAPLMSDPSIALPQLP